MAVRPPIVNVMANAAMKAARALKRDFGEVEHLQVSKKGTADFVTNADITAERVLRGELEKAHPRYGFLMEESGATSGADASHRWIVDPLDGTLNFMHGLPHFAISIALESHGEIVAGVIYDPLRDEMFWADRGKGAHMNDRRIRVSARRHLGEAVLATGIPFKGRRTHPAYLDTLAAVMASCAGVRRFGAASLDMAWVAAGRFDGFWEFALSPWDVAAGIVIVREAGGYATEIDGGTEILSSGDVLAANPEIHPEIGVLLRDAIATHGPAHPAETAPRESDTA